MTENVIALLKEFDAINGISGHEEAVAERLKTHLMPITDEYMTDALGNVFFVKKGKDPLASRIMIAAHMDEIGFLINDIYEDGRLSIMPVGMVDPRTVCNQVLTIETKNGPLDAVVCGLPAPHEKEDTGEKRGFEHLKLDIGAASKEEAKRMGVRLGDAVNNRRGCRLLNGHLFSGKSVDDRSGVAAMILTAQRLAETQIDNTVIFCGTVQEELFLKGARIAANTAKPDVCISVDVCLGVEDDTVSRKHSRTYVGKGPCIQIYDWDPDIGLGNIVPVRLVEALRTVAENNQIPSQDMLMIGGGTDTAEISLSRQGVVSGALGIPARYIHSAISYVDVQDVVDTARLLDAFVREFRKNP